MENQHKLYEGTLEEIHEQIEQDKTPAPEPAPEPTPEPTPEPGETPTPAPEFDRLKFLGEALSTEFKTEEDFETYKRSLNEWKGKAEDAEKQLKSFDLMKHFASPDDYIINQLKIKHPDLDSAVLMNTLTADLEKVDPIRVIAYHRLLSDPKHEVYDNEAQAYNQVLKEVGYDSEAEYDQQSDEVKVSIRQMVRNAKNEFSKLKSEIEVPKSIDLTEEKNKKDLELQQRYDRIKTLSSPDIRKIPELLSKIDLMAKDKDGKDEVLFSYQLGDFGKSKRVQDVLAQVQDAIAKNALEWTPDMAEKITKATIEDIEKDYFWANRGKIAREMKESWYKQWNDEKFEKDNHSRPLEPERVNPTMTEEQKKLRESGKQFAKNLGLKGRKTYAP